MKKILQLLLLFLKWPLLEPKMFIVALFFSLTNYFFSIFRLMENLNQKDPAWRENGKGFVESVTRLLERLLDYRNVGQVRIFFLYFLLFSREKKRYACVSNFLSMCLFKSDIRIGIGFCRIFECIFVLQHDFDYDKSYTWKKMPESSTQCSKIRKKSAKKNIVKSLFSHTKKNMQKRSI